MNINSLNSAQNFGVLADYKKYNTVTNPNLKAQEKIEIPAKQMVNAQTALVNYTMPKVNMSFKGSPLQELQESFYNDENMENFAASIAKIAQDKQNTTDQGEFKIEKLPHGWQGVYNHSSRTVTIDPEKMLDLADIVDTINHEYRHKYQHELVDRVKNDDTYTYEEAKIALEFIKGMQSYVSSEENFYQYYNNPIEVDAREAGYEAWAEFTTEAHKLAEKLNIPVDVLLYNPQHKPKDDGDSADMLIIDEDTKNMLPDLEKKLEEEIKQYEAEMEVLKRKQKQQKRIPLVLTI